MLQNMSSSEMIEWIAYYKIKHGIEEDHPAAEPAKPRSTLDILRSMFAKKIVKKKK